MLVCSGYMMSIVCPTLKRQEKNTKTNEISRHLLSTPGGENKHREKDKIIYSVERGSSIADDLPEATLSLRPAPLTFPFRASFLFCASPSLSASMSLSA